MNNTKFDRLALKVLDINEDEITLRKTNKKEKGCNNNVVIRNFSDEDIIRLQKIQEKLIETINNRKDDTIFNKIIIRISGK